jgi:hypothetical protein
MATHFTVERGQFNVQADLQEALVRLGALPSRTSSCPDLRLYCTPRKIIIETDLNSFLKRSSNDVAIEPSELPDFDRRNDLYSPLDPAKRQIRILRVLRSIETTAALSCELRIVSVGVDCPPLALSYVWGSLSSPQHLGVRQVRQGLPSNEVDVPVTAALHTALRYIRNNWAGEEPIDMWVDTICINQHDMAERSSQVAMMREIYESTSCVLVWLGHESRTVARLFPVIHSLSAKLTTSKPSDEDRAMLQTLAECMIKGPCPETTLTQWIFAFLNLPYWTRG